MVRDVSSTLSEGIGYERIHDQEWQEFLEASDKAGDRASPWTTSWPVLVRRRGRMRRRRGRSLLAVSSRETGTTASFMLTCTH